MKLLLLFCVLWALFSLGSCDPCDWSGVTPDSYKDYSNECQPRRTVQSDGHCDLTKAPKCKSFCQVKTNFEYATEMPLGGTYARGPGWFGSSDWMRFGFHWEEPVKPFPKGVDFDALNDGISGGLSRASKGLAEITHMDVLLDENECGYFTFLPMIKNVCGTYTEASGKNCDRSKKSKANICVKEMSNWQGQNAFYKWAYDQYGEPTVRGHMTFVRTDCKNGHRMSLNWQSERYQVASKHGAALSGEDYEGWRKVWNNPLISDKMLPATYGPKDEEQVCLSTRSASDTTIKDSLVSECWYRIGGLMKEPNKLLPYGETGHQYLDRTWYGGCNIYLKFTEDWSEKCDVSYAELATAAIPTTFVCLKKQFYRGKDRWGVKGTHSLRKNGNCGGQAVVWGGDGRGINIGGNKGWANLDNLTLSVLETLPNITAPPGTGFDACSDSPCRPFGELANASTLSEYGRFPRDGD